MASNKEVLLEGLGANRADEYKACLQKFLEAQRIVRGIVEREGSYEVAWAKFGEEVGGDLYNALNDIEDFFEALPSVALDFARSTIVAALKEEMGINLLSEIRDFRMEVSLDTWCLGVFREVCPSPEGEPQTS